jgi:hypothetical protein
VRLVGLLGHLIEKDVPAVLRNQIPFAYCKHKARLQPGSNFLQRSPFFPQLNAFQQRLVSL